MRVATNCSWEPPDEGVTHALHHLFPEQVVVVVDMTAHGLERVESRQKFAHRPVRHMIDEQNIGQQAQHGGADQLAPRHVNAR